MNDSFTYPGLSSYTLVPEPNASYLSHTSTPIIAPMDSSTLGLMMLLSTFQYQAPYMNPVYSNAASQAGKAAFITSGGQNVQDRLTDQSKDIAKSMGLTDTEIGILAGSAKVYRDRQINVNGPKVYSVRTKLTADQNSGSIVFKYEW